MDQGLQQPLDRVQVWLWDLIVLVVGASYVLDVARRSSLAWGGGRPDLPHAIGLGVLTLGMGVGLVMMGLWVRLLRQRKGRGWAFLWRVLAVGWLGGSMVEVASALQDENATLVMMGAGDHAAMRLRLTSLMTTLGIVGLVLAAIPIRPSPGSPRPEPRWGSWPSVSLAAVLGIALVALGHGFFPYLVMIALEAVQNALTRAPLVARPIVFDRMVTASLEALPGLLGCLATAVWVDDDLRSAARDPIGSRAPRSWRGVIARASTVVLAASGSAYIWFVSIPKLNPNLAEGFATMIDPSSIATIALGFAALAVGFPARSAAHLAIGGPPVGPESPPRRLGPWPRRAIVGIAGLACVEITAAAVGTIRGDLDDRWYAPIGLESWNAIVRVPATWVGYPAAESGWFLLVERPDEFLIAAAAIWSTVQLARLILSRGPDRPSPLDAIAYDRLALGRFLGCWIGLTTVMLASLPGLFVVGVTVIHFVIRWAVK